MNSPYLSRLKSLREELEVMDAAWHSAEEWRELLGESYELALVLFGLYSESEELEEGEESAEVEGKCCADEHQDWSGGCTNCGDPC